MNEDQLKRYRPYITATVLVAEIAHLAYEHSNGGVVSHNLLNRPDLPAISNWWGLILLPVLTWFVIGRVQRRVASNLKDHGQVPKNIILGFIGSLLYGIVLACSFALGYGAVSSYLFGGMLLLAILLPIYRAEYLLGFVLGMTFTFGAVLPTVIGAIFGIISVSIGSLLRWGSRHVIVLFRRNDTGA